MHTPPLVPPSARAHTARFALTWAAAAARGAAMSGAATPLPAALRALPAPR